MSKNKESRKKYTITKIIKIIVLYVCLVIIAQGVFWLLVHTGVTPFEDLYLNGAILKFKKLGYAMVFAHGSYSYDCDLVELHYIKVRTNNQTYLADICINKTMYHSTYYQGQKHKTIDLVNQLQQQGYKKVWLSQCHTGDKDYMILYHNNTYVDWYDWVDRVEKPGVNVALFYGFGVYRFNTEW